MKYKEVCLKNYNVFNFNLKLISDCQFVLNLHDRFLKLFEDKSFNPEILSFIETSFTLMSVFYLKIVTFDSAGIEINS